MGQLLECLADVVRVSRARRRRRGDRGYLKVNKNNLIFLTVFNISYKYFDFSSLTVYGVLPSINKAPGDKCLLSSDSTAGKMWSPLD